MNRSIAVAVVAIVLALAASAGVLVASIGTLGGPGQLGRQSIRGIRIDASTSRPALEVNQSGTGLAAANARLFGLGVDGGWLYHGVVDSRETAQLPGRLAAYVYRSRADGSEMELVLQFELDYRREECGWQPWQSSWDRRGLFCEPMLTDVEFRPNGDLILGLRDRFADSDVFSRGDILPTLRLGQQWQAVVDPEHYVEHAFAPDGTMRWNARIRAGSPGADVGFAQGAPDDGRRSA